MTAWFDSLVHANADGRWFGADRYDAGPDRLIRELDAVGDWRACLVGIAGESDDDFTLELARRQPERFVPVAGVDPTTLTDEDQTMRGIAGRGFRGIKLHPRLNGYDPLSSQARSAVAAAGRAGLVVFLDTLFRRKGVPTRHPVDVIDVLVHDAEGPLVLLHGGGAHLLELFEIGRAHDHVLVDLSFTIMRYAGSSLDDDIAFVCRTLDQRIVIGSDMPEYRPCDVVARLDELTAGLDPGKRRNIVSGNLTALFS